MITRPWRAAVMLAAVVAMVAAGAAAWLSATAPLWRTGAASDAADTGLHPTVTIVGAPGTFGGVTGTTPSGQSFGTTDVPGWSFPPGLKLQGAVIAADGTVMMSTAAQSLDPAKPTARQLAVATYAPRTRAFALVTIASAADLSAPSITSLEPLAASVLFTASAPSAGDPSWPVFGVLSTVGGRWGVAHGPQWTNQWTAAQLGLGPGGLAGVVRLPGSGDLMLARADGSLAAVRLAGPDAGGRYDARVVARYDLPDLGLQQSASHLVADPTRRRGEERFALLLYPHEPDTTLPTVLQEFGYDANTASIAPASAPILPGDTLAGAAAGPVMGYNAIAYDHRGYLWAARNFALAGGSLGLYTRPRCGYDPARSLASYRSVIGRRAVLGTPCRPDYEFLQARSLQAGVGLAENPATGDMVLLASAGAMMAVRVIGATTAPQFQIGNVLDLGRDLLPSQVFWNNVAPGAFDSRGRFWLAADQADSTRAGAALDQWLYVVDAGDLLAPPPLTLTDVPGQTTVLQAERTLTVGTVQRPGSTAGVEVDSEAYVTACVDSPASLGCGYDGVPGNGYAINDYRFLGKLEGGVEYRVHVSRAGTYRIGFHTFTFPVITTAAIRLTADGRTYTTPVNTGGNFYTVWIDNPVSLPAGDQVIRLDVPDIGRGGWVLNSIVLRRA